MLVARTILTLALMGAGLTHSALAEDTTGVVFVGTSQTPTVGIPLTATSRSGQTITVTTDENGSFSLELPEGEWMISVASPNGFTMESPYFSVGTAGAELLFGLGETRDTSTLQLEANIAKEAPEEEVIVEADAVDITGLVTDNDGAPLTDVRIFIRGNATQAITDKKGMFTLQVVPGLYEFTAIKQGYASRTFSNIAVPLDGALVMPMVKAGLTSEALTVSAPRIEGGTASLLSERREVNVVADVLGAEQMSKSGDSDAAGALSRVTGLTVVDGKFVFVRGLGERYSASLLNGANLPSPDPERRVVPLDLIPVGMLESIVIQKTFSPDMPAEFGGGVIALRSKAVPEEFTAKVSLSSGYLSQTTFTKGLQGQAGPTDWLGFGKRQRALPENVSNASNENPLEETDMFSSRGYTAEELEAFGESMDSSRWALENRAIRPNLGFSAEVGNGHSFGKNRLGYSAGLIWGNDWERLEFDRQYFSVGDGGSVEPSHKYRFEELTNQINLSTIASVGADFGENHSIALTSLWMRNTENANRIYTGFNRDVDDDIRVTRLRWVERELTYHQLRGEHSLPQMASIELGWQTSLSYANRNEPDRRETRYDYEVDSGVWYLSDRPEGNSLFFSDLNDRNVDVSAYAKVPFVFPWNTEEESSFKFGFQSVSRNRTVDTRRYKYFHKGPDSNDPDVQVKPAEDVFTAENIGSNGFQFEEHTLPTDNYTGTQRIQSGFIMAEFVPVGRLRILGGARLERSVQTVQTFELFNPDNNPVKSDLSTSDVLPAVTLTQGLTNRNSATDIQVRFAYGRTLNRPNFRELSPATFNDVTGGRQEYGNPDLDRALIDNMDLRFECYFSPTEYISIAGFNKEFDSPIVDIIVPSAQLSVTKMNAERATVRGLEVDFRTSFAFISPALGDLYLGGNAAWISSKAILSENIGIQGTENPRFQGQSPYVYNLQLMYDNPDTLWTATVLYNVSGPRITEYGAYSMPDTSREPFHRLDFVASKTLKERLKISMKFQNILGSRTESVVGDAVVDSIQRGRALSLGVGLTF